MSAVEKPEVVPRRYGAALDEAIRQAVRDELEAHTYARLTFEGVAKRAQTSKPVIYRRYASRAQMVIDAWVRYTPTHEPPFVSSGELRRDLLTMARAFSNRFERIGVETMRGLLAEMPPNQIERITDPSPWVRSALATLLVAAQQRGEITRTTFPSRLQSLPLVLVRHELMFTGTFGETALTEIIDTVWMPLLIAKD